MQITNTFGMKIKNNILPRIIFFGTPEFARYCLEYILEQGFQVLAVVSAPDRKAGRGKQLTPSIVKTFSEKKGLKVLQPENLKAPEFISALNALQPDIQVVVAFRMLPKSVWEIPTFGTVNLHASLLPDYRGAAPINWVLINGEKETGVTTFLINEQIDTGAILKQQSISIAENENAESLHDGLLQIGASLLAQTLIELFEKKLKPQPQLKMGNEKEAPKLTNENTQIDMEAPIRNIIQKINGLAPYPGAWISIREGNTTTRMKIFKASALYEHPTDAPKYLRIRNNQLLIAVKEGYINCEEIQLPNKKRMSAKDLLNGFSFKENAQIE